MLLYLYNGFMNDMWRIFGLIFFNDKEHFFNKETKTINKEGIKEMLTKYKIGIGETATEVIRTRDNASDKYLEIVTPVNLTRLFTKAPSCEVIVTTGEKAATVIATLTNSPIPKMGEHISCVATMDDGTMREFIHWRCPSTSRAFPMKLEEKKSYYIKMLESSGVINN